jgi:hypothetical protein
MEGDADDPLAGLDEERMAGVMDSLAAEMEGMDDSAQQDPKQLARFLARFQEATGLEAGPKMEEMMARLAEGADMDELEAQMGGPVARPARAASRFRERRRGRRGGRLQRLLPQEARRGGAPQGAARRRDPALSSAALCGAAIGSAPVTFGGDRHPRVSSRCRSPSASPRRLLLLALVDSPLHHQAGHGLAPGDGGGGGGLMAIWWLTEAIPIYWTACLPIVLFPALGVFGGAGGGGLAGFGAAISPYFDPYIFLFAGGMASPRRCSSGTSTAASRSASWQDRHRSAPAARRRPRGHRLHLALDHQHRDRDDDDADRRRPHRPARSAERPSPAPLRHGDHAGDRLRLEPGRYRHQDRHGAQRPVRRLPRAPGQVGQSFVAVPARRFAVRRSSLLPARLVRCSGSLGRRDHLAGDARDVVDRELAGARRGPAAGAHRRPASSWPPQPAGSRASRSSTRSRQRSPRSSSGPRTSRAASRWLAALLLLVLAASRPPGARGRRALRNRAVGDAPPPRRRLRDGGRHPAERPLELARRSARGHRDAAAARPRSSSRRSPPSPSRRSPPTPPSRTPWPRR